MSKEIILTLIEIGVGIIFESIILGLIFQQLSNQSVDNTKQALQNEMNNIEAQNKFMYEQLQQEIRSAKNDVISELKEVMK